MKRLSLLTVLLVGCHAAPQVNTNIQATGQGVQKIDTHFENIEHSAGLLKPKGEQKPLVDNITFNVKGGRATVQDVNKSIEKLSGDVNSLIEEVTNKTRELIALNTRFKWAAAVEAAWFWFKCSIGLALVLSLIFANEMPAGIWRKPFIFLFSIPGRLGRLFKRSAVGE